jgi:hypothetical protein
VAFPKLISLPRPQLPRVCSPPDTPIMPLRPPKPAASSGGPHHYRALVRRSPPPHWRPLARRCRAGRSPDYSPRRTSTMVSLPSIPETAPAWQHRDRWPGVSSIFLFRGNMDFHYPNKTESSAITN